MTTHRFEIKMFTIISLSESLENLLEIFNGSIINTKNKITSKLVACRTKMNKFILCSLLEILLIN